MILCKVDSEVVKVEVNEQTKFIIELAFIYDSLLEVYIPESVIYVYSFPNLSTGSGVIVVFEDTNNWYVNDTLIDSTRMDDMDYIREIYFDNFDIPWVKKQKTKALEKSRFYKLKCGLDVG